MTPPEQSACPAALLLAPRNIREGIVLVPTEPQGRRIVTNNVVFTPKELIWSSRFVTEKDRCAELDRTREDTMQDTQAQILDLMFTVQPNGQGSTRNSQ